MLGVVVNPSALVRASRRLAERSGEGRKCRRDWPLSYGRGCWGGKNSEGRFSEGMPVERKNGVSRIEAIFSGCVGLSVGTGASHILPVPSNGPRRNFIMYGVCRTVKLRVDDVERSNRY